MAMRLLDLFSGIGGFSYAAEKLIGGYETVAFCEMDEFCQKVLKKHWPQVPIFDDVRILDASRLGRIDICTFGFPCQPVSQAGLQKAESDDRWLWDEIIRILQASKPKWIIAENVKGLISIEDGLLIEKCLSDLEAEGYEVQPIIIPACAKNAPHRRDRVWIIGQNVDDSNDSTDRAKRGKTRKEDSLQKEYRQTGFSWFSDRTSDDSEPLANSDSRRSFKKHSSTINRENEGLRSKHESSANGAKETGTNVADTESINRNVNGIVREHGEAKTQKIPRNRDGISDTQGQTVANAQRRFRETQLQRQQSILRKQNSKGKTTRPSNKDLSDRGSRSVEQRVGDMADGLSRGLLRHFDREPEHIPRVTTEEKDRAKKLKALGNSIVPQVAAEILLAIRVSEESD